MGILAGETTLVDFEKEVGGLEWNWVYPNFKVKVDLTMNEVQTEHNCFLNGVQT